MVTESRIEIIRATGATDLLATRALAVALGQMAYSRGEIIAGLRMDNAELESELATALRPYPDTRATGGGSEDRFRT